MCTFAIPIINVIKIGNKNPLNNNKNAALPFSESSTNTNINTSPTTNELTDNNVMTTISFDNSKV